MNITLNAQTLRYISIFEAATNAEVKDCIEKEDTIIFIVQPHNIKKVLVNHGEKIQTLRKMLQKNVIVYEYSPDVVRFTRNVFRRYGVKNVKVTNENGEFSLIVYVDQKEKARAIGRDGKNLRLAREIIGRHFPIKSIIIM
ncbi:MAG: NusA-like transcription termination signal-binding factor [Euryarchaeota archaeon]|nr:NusA-like transcription termination signal-binding factor [Euryarchaeota archaeon]